MKIQLWTIGKSNEKYIEEGIQLFTKRLNNYYAATWKIIPGVKNAASLSENELRDKESDLLISLLRKEDILILLDERGKLLSSPELASKLTQLANAGSRSLVFIIGGAYGVNEGLRKRSDLVWSLSPLVFPHQLVRLILSEQLYRACTIINNEKYHHS